MKNYIATFHTHFAAMTSCKRLCAAGVAAQLAPVPRALSSSCGVCVRYCAESPMEGLMHHDMERIVEAAGDGYTAVLTNGD